LLISEPLSKTWRVTFAQTTQLIAPASTARKNVFTGRHWHRALLSLESKREAQALVGAVRLGDQASFAVLFGQHYAGMPAVAYRILGRLLHAPPQARPEIGRPPDRTFSRPPNS
jgi:hypothetical protein